MWKAEKTNAQRPTSDIEHPTSAVFNVAMNAWIVAVFLILSGVVGWSDVPKSSAGAQQTNSVAELVQQGKRLYEFGKNSEAKAILKQALKLEPSNKAAYYYLDLMKEAEYKQRAAVREDYNGEMLLTDPPKSAKTGEWLGPRFVRETPSLPVPKPFLPSLPMKSFQLDMKVVTEKLHLVPDGKTVIQKIGDVTYVTRGKHYEERQQQVKEWVRDLGVDLNAPGRMVFLNERVGLLQVRAIDKEFELIETAVQPMLARNPQSTKGENKP